jgi:nucleoside-diphosphate-sugar epimerase
LKLLIFGAGYSGQAIARRLAGSTGDDGWIAGTTRSRERFASLTAAGMRPLLFDGETIAEDLRGAMASATHVIQSIAPDEAGDPLLNLVEDAGAAFFPQAVWFGYLSTVGVYGDHGGDWVDEETPCRPVSDRSVQRLAAEDAWSAFGERLSRPVAILRLSGIYGPGRSAFDNFAKGTARRLVKPGQVFNRIRVEDIAAAAEFLMAKDAGGLWNVTDDEPAPPQDVVAFASRLMGVEPPPEIDFETAELSPMARSFYGENKRVSNAKIKAAGFEFAFPDYRKSLEQLWSVRR